MPKKKKKELNLEDCRFEADGQVYVFVYPSIKFKSEKGGYEVLTAQQLVATEGTGEDKKEVHADKLAKLVATGSAAIRKEVDDATE